jgi:hypothetical protein
MPNVRIRPALEKIERDLSKLMNYISEYSGIPAGDAAFVNNEATSIAQVAAQLAAAARAVRGDLSSDSVIDDIRQALG